MALWTPYADTVLDLSKSSRIHKYPSPEPTVYHFGYNYVPVPQISPLSAASISSYEGPFTPQLFPISDRITTQMQTTSVERLFTPVVPGGITLSPPVSPQAVKRQYSMVDDSLSDDPDFQAFERDALRAMAENNGGAVLGNNPRMRRNIRSNNGSADDSFRKQRERNNFAAKQSRDRRKLREIHLALKVSYLKREMSGLKSALASRICNRCDQSCRY